MFICVNGKVIINYLLKTILILTLVDLTLSVCFLGASGFGVVDFFETWTLGRGGFSLSREGAGDLAFRCSLLKPIKTRTNRHKHKAVDYIVHI